MVGFLITILYVKTLLLVINMGTSCQLAFPEFLATVPSSPDPSSPVQYFPYFNNQYLAVAASLNGGNVLSHFVNMIQNWMGYLGKLNFRTNQAYQHCCTITWLGFKGAKWNNIPKTMLMSKCIHLETCTCTCVLC